MATKNITVKIDEEVYRRARVWAAERDTSVSALVRDFLENIEVRDREGGSEKDVRRRALLEEIWAMTDALPRLEKSAAMESREALYEEAMTDRGLR